MDFIVLGDINIDIITQPIKIIEKEVSIVQDDFFVVPGGNAANIAIELSSLGSSVHFIGALGRDPISKWLIEILKKNNISHSISIKEKSSGITFAITYTNGTRTFIATLGSNKELEINDIKLDNVSALHLHRAGYWWAPKLIGQLNDKIFKNAKEKGMTTSLSLSWDPNNWKYAQKLLDNLKYCDIIMMNQKELMALTSANNLEAGIQEFKRYYSGLIVIHQGEKGSLIISDNKEIYIPGNKIISINPTGSGDIYDAAFIYGFKQGWNLKKVGEFANACAEIRIQNLEKNYPTLNDVINYLKR
ncbi:MAG: carbohydrate kinase family protein [Candidatus Helarchaeota archaeon]